MLKAQLHVHANEDPWDDLDYSAKDLIDKASELKFDVVAFTFHKTLYYPKELVEYAKKKRILLIPGIEERIEGKDVLILGLDKLPQFKTLRDLEQVKDKALIIAPHPFYPKRNPFYSDHNSLNKKLEENIDLFQGIEYSFFYVRFFNYFNNKARRIAKKYNLFFLGTGDVHRLNTFDYTYSLIDSEKNIPSVIKAIKNKKIKIVTKPLPLVSTIYMSIKIFLNMYAKK